MKLSELKQQIKQFKQVNIIDYHDKWTEFEYELRLSC